jgi:hypothetical protein
LFLPGGKISGSILGLSLKNGDRNNKIIVCLASYVRGTGASVSFKHPADKDSTPKSIFLLELA